MKIIVRDENCPEFHHDVDGMKITSWFMFKGKKYGVKWIGTEPERANLYLYDIFKTL